jgi:hypothetical protein
MERRASMKSVNIQTTPLGGDALKGPSRQRTDTDTNNEYKGLHSKESNE